LYTTIKYRITEKIARLINFSFNTFSYFPCSKNISLIDWYRKIYINFGWSLIFHNVWILNLFNLMSSYIYNYIHVICNVRMRGVATPMVMAITMTTLYEKCIIDIIAILARTYSFYRIMSQHVSIRWYSCPRVFTKACKLFWFQWRNFLNFANELEKIMTIKN